MDVDAEVPLPTFAWALVTIEAGNGFAVAAVVAGGTRHVNTRIQ